MKREDLKSIHDRAKALGVIAIGIDNPGWGESEFNSVQIWDDGEIAVVFCHYRNGDTDTNVVMLTDDDFAMSTEDFTAKEKKAKAVRDHESRLKMSEFVETARAQAEEEERELLKKLKTKYESDGK
jgi:hypothetical protein